MAVERRTWVAAASHLAKLAHETGQFHAAAESCNARVDPSDHERVKETILEDKINLRKATNEKERTLCALGGGHKDIEVYCL